MKILISLILIISLASCATVDVAKEAIWIDNKIGTGEVQESLNKVDLTQAEEQIITHALNSVLKFRTTYGEFISNPGKLLAINPETLGSDYQELRNRFFEVEEIVFKNFSKYDQETQNKLKSYQDHAIKLDMSVGSLMKEKSYRTAISTALSYGFTALQVVASLK